MAALIDPAFVQAVAEGLGLKPSDDAAKSLAPDVEYRLREVVQDAIKFARHSKRSHITSADVNNALRMRNVRPIYGFSDSRNPARFVQAVGHPDVFYAEDPIVPVASEIEKPLRPPPWETAVRPHWLAINGKQPALPENTPLQPSHRAKRQRTAAPAVPVPAAAPAAAPPASGAPADTAGAAAGEEGALVRAPLRHMVSQELHLYFNKVKALLAPGRQQAEDGNNSNEEATQEAAAAAVAESPEGATPSAETRAVLASLRRNAGLQPLAPYLSHLIAQGIADNMQHPRRLSLLLRAADCLVYNKDLDLGLYLHQIAPALLTCLLAQTVGAASDAPAGPAAPAAADHSEESTDDSLLRAQAARAVAALCAAYPDAAPRVQRQLVAVLTDPSKPLLTLYGAVVGIAALGPRAVKALLLPNLVPCMAALTRSLSGGKGATAQAQALQVRAALLNAAGHCVYRSRVCASWNVGPATQQRSGVPSPSSGQEAAKVTGKRGKSGRQPKKVVKCAAVSSLQRAAAAPRPQSKQPRAAAVAKMFGGPDDGEEEQEQQRQAATAAAAAAAKSSGQVRPLVWRPCSGSDEGGAAGPSAFEPSIPPTNELAEAWREDFALPVLHRVMAQLFGPDLAPYERVGPGGEDASTFTAAFL